MFKILVIEDDDLLRENITDMLTLEGFEVQDAENGRVGLRRATEFRPDLIVCDVVMPEFTGYEVLLALRQNAETATIPFIFLTGQAKREQIRYGMRLGADDYIPKPFKFAELRSAIDARLKRHATIQQMVEQDLAQARQSLIRMVSHELRTPLISVNMVAEIISRQIDHLTKSQLRELIDTLERGAHRMNRLVEQIVFIIQLESQVLSQSSVRENGVSTHLSDVVMAATDLARRFSYRQPDVRVRVDEHDTDTLIVCDIRALRHALAELLSNALSFSPAGSEVLLTQWHADHAVWISIIDQGPGIPPELIDNALKDFQQIDRETQEQQGIGLGLPLARRIIEAHGGSFELKSVLGKGTQITISIPDAQSEG